jgi:hypothetical protein
MPTIAIVDGIRVVIFPNDHEPPHFHAFLTEHRIRIDIMRAQVIGWRGPRAMEAKILSWTVEHQKQLLAAWEAIRSGEPPERI